VLSTKKEDFHLLVRLICSIRKSSLVREESA